MRAIGNYLVIQEIKEKPTLDAQTDEVLIETQVVDSTPEILAPLTNNIPAGFDPFTGLPLAPPLVPLPPQNIVPELPRIKTVQVSLKNVTLKLSKKSSAVTCLYVLSALDSTRFVPVP